MALAGCWSVLKPSPGGVRGRLKRGRREYGIIVDMIRIVIAKDEAVARFNARPAFPEEAEEAARAVLGEIRRRGDAAVAEAVAKFEGARLEPSQFRLDVPDAEALAASLPARVVGAVKLAHANVKRFSEASLRRPWSAGTEHGGEYGEYFSPMERVGVYIPGGTAPLASTAIHTVTLAKAAGVREIVACTPAGKTGEVNPVLVYALALAGATEIYRVGGIQAIGMMAFGTATCRKVEKIAGPGNAFVTAAKRQVYGFAAIDQVAGPSEIAVLADGAAKASWVAADLLSQAEHGSGWERSLCVCLSEGAANAILGEVLRQKETLPRKALVERVIERDGILIVVASSLDEAFGVVNGFAPEHLEVIAEGVGVEEVRRRVTAAGAIFVGPWTPESSGDFVAGPSHVLPTGGAARMFSGLTPDDFRRRHSFVSLSREDLAASRDAIEAFAEVEGLGAHGRAATIRFEDR